MRIWKASQLNLAFQNHKVSHIKIDYEVSILKNHICSPRHNTSEMKVPLTGRAQRCHYQVQNLLRKNCKPVPSGAGLLQLCSLQCPLPELTHSEDCLVRRGRSTCPWPTATSWELTMLRTSCVPDQGTQVLIKPTGWWNNEQNWASAIP